MGSYGWWREGVVVTGGQVDSSRIGLSSTSFNSASSALSPAQPVPVPVLFHLPLHRLLVITSAHTSFHSTRFDLHRRPSVTRTSHHLFPILSFHTPSRLSTRLSACPLSASSQRSPAPASLPSSTRGRLPGRPPISCIKASMPPLSTAPLPASASSRRLPQRPTRRSLLRLLFPAPRRLPTAPCGRPPRRLRKTPLLLLLLPLL